MMDTTQDNEMMYDCSALDSMQQQEDADRCHQTFFAEHKELSELIKQYQVKECYENIQQTGTAINRIVGFKVVKIVSTQTFFKAVKIYGTKSIIGSSSHSNCFGIDAYCEKSDWTKF